MRQYTPGALWTAMAFAALGDGPRAWELTAMTSPVNHARTPQGVVAQPGNAFHLADDGHEHHAEVRASAATRFLD